MIGKRKDAIKIKKGISGRTFPNDYNWVCPVCKNECRAFEQTCQYCKHETWINQ